MTSLTFLGAAKTVTGSKYLLVHNNTSVLIDCGLFQGLKELRRLNWEQFLKVDEDVLMTPADIDYLILTHAHIDHSGYTPKFINQGFRGQILTTEITKDLCEILLKDSAKLQEEEARYANKKGYSKHDPARPLYTVEDAEKAMQYFKVVDRNEFISLSPDMKFRFRNAGHILGSSFVEVWINQGKETIKLVFSGDLGRLKTPILQDPDYAREADYLIMESTYGNRLHPAYEPEKDLIPVINEIYKNKSVLLMPAFAVERTQEIIYQLKKLSDAGVIPNIPIYIDSPMASSVTQLFESHKEIYDTEAKAMLDKDGKSIFKSPNIHFTTSQEESKALNDKRGPMIIISASGMATGGRILHHLTARLPDPKNIILMVGYQAVGTRGRALMDGAKSLKIHGLQVPVNAKIVSMSSFSAHADYSEILKWLKGLKKPPKLIFLVHGEEDSLMALSYKIKEEYKWETYIPEYLECVKLGREVPPPVETNRYIL